MLRELAIRNFAIIDDLSLTFDDGLTVLTGETGAGKSILINAVNLIMGARASADLVRTAAETAELEALFELSGQGEALAAAAAQDIDLSEGLLIRRVIDRSGRHKIYINGRLATGRMLSEMQSGLTSISGQHAYQHLLRAEEHLRLLDAFGGTETLCREVAQQYHRLLPVLKRLDQLKEEKRDRSSRMELLEFQVREIAAAGIEDQEDERLERDIHRARHAERLYETIARCMEALYEEDGAVVERLGALGKELDGVSSLDEDLGEITGRIEATRLELTDVTEEMRAYLEDMTFDRHSLESMAERLDVLQKLKRKYGGSLAAVLKYGDDARRELDQVTALPEKIRETETALAAVEKELKAACRSLSDKRRRSAGRLAEAVKQELASLGMEGTRFEVRFKPVPLSEDSPSVLMMDDGGIENTGSERAEFLIAPNVGEDPKPLANIASGGELSRIVLALKSILAKRGAVETLIFDEVDAGIGGKVAEMVGEKLAALAEYHQVICITHLPQIACFGNSHYRIDKTVSGGRTRTAVSVLDEEGRVGELARMVGGAKVSAKTLAYAREMLAHRKPKKAPIKGKKKRP